MDIQKTVVEWLKNRKTDVLTVLVVVVSSGLAGEFLGLWDVSLSRQDSYIEKYIQANEQKNALILENARLREQKLTLELATSDIPFPYWVKSLDSEILYISDSYEQMLLIPKGFSKKDLVGTKGEIFGEAFVDEIVKNDLMVISRNQILRFEEEVPDFGKGISYKYPIRNHSGTTLLLGGIWLPSKIEKH